MTPAIQGTRVRGLRPGDILHPTGRIVRSYPRIGVRTPTGKLEVIVSSRRHDHQDGPGRDRAVEWRADTRITVIR